MPKEPRASSATPSSRRAPSLGPAPRTASTTWTPEEDEILMRERAHGSNWGPISTKHFPNKTPNACRKRHERLMERRRDEDWDEEKLQNLAVHYMEVRRAMWGVLADRLGEKFNVVEQKVCLNFFPLFLFSLHSSSRPSPFRKKKKTLPRHGRVRSASPRVQSNDLQIEALRPDDLCVMIAHPKMSTNLLLYPH
jgi:hypothetical protein